MKTTVDSDLSFEASEEAKICLTCKKQKCVPWNCDRFKTMKRKLKQKETTPKQKKLKSGGNFENESIE